MRKKSPRLIVVAAARGRAGLLRTTALQAAAVLAFVSPGLAQPAPGARPGGGVVVGGAASIGQTAATTTVAQSSQRAAIDWRSFDVGSAHSVQFQQPNSTAVVLNRVTGPDPSQIAGRISANGQVVITNQSGVVFHQGSRVDAAGLIVSAAGISTPNFMAGRMVFDIAPKPDAMVSNAGTITVKEAGLAALVAPRVANSGVINARMGRAVLAGAETHTVDLYGDGLLSIDVTGQVRQAPRGPDGKPVTALVTNTGTIVADGGSVVLTAAAADGIVQNLVQAGGRVQANAVDGRAGTVVVAGVGGSVRIEGRVSTNGGGSVLATASDAVTVAASARITANGLSGGVASNGGTVTIGNRTGTRTVTVEQGAVIAANARTGGNGGQVKLLSSGTTTFDGRVFARGGRESGDGGQVEVSGGTVTLTGVVDAQAPKGRRGTLLIDPTDVTVSDHGGTGTVLTPASLEAQQTDISLQADNSIVFASSLSLPGSDSSLSLTINSGNFIRVDPGVTLLASGRINFQQAPGGVSILGNLTGRVNLNTTGAVTQGAGSVITTNLIDGTAGSIALTSATNAIQRVGGDNGLTATAGDIRITSPTLDVQGGYFTAGLLVPSGRTIALTADTLTFTANNSPTASAPNGTILIQPLTNNRPMEVTTTAPTANTLSINAGSLPALQSATLALGSATTGAVDLNASGTGRLINYGLNRTVFARSGVSVGQTGPVQAGTFSGTAPVIDLSNGGNTINAIGTVSTTGAFSLHTGDVLTVSGGIASGGAVNLSSGNTMTLAADVRGSTVRFDSFNGDTLGSSGAIVQTAGTVTTGSLTGQGQSLTLGNANQITGIGDFHTAAGFSVATGTDLNIAGTVLNDAGTVALNAVGRITQSLDNNALISTPVFTGSAASVDFFITNHRIGTLGPFTTTTRGFGLTLAPGSPFTIQGPVTVPTGQTVSITSDTVAFGTGATINAPGGVVAFSPATIGRPIELTSGAATAGSLSISQAGINGITAGGLGLGVSASGPVTLGKAGESIDLTGHVNGLDVLSSGAISQGAGARVTVGTLSATGLSVNLPGANGIAQLSLINTTGGVTVNSVRNLAVNSVTAGGAAAITTSGAMSVGLLNAGSVSLGAGTGGILHTGNLTTAGTLDYATAGAVTQTGGTITANTLTGRTGAISLTQAGNQIANLGPFVATGDFSLTNGRSLTLAGDLDPPNVTMTIAGDLVLNSSISATNTVTLNVTGAITEGARAGVFATTLQGNAASARLDTNISVGDLAGFATTSGLVFVNRQALSVSGPVTDGASIAITGTGNPFDGTPALTVTGRIAAPSITLTGVKATGPSVGGATSGQIVQTGGSIAGGTVAITSANGVSQTGGNIVADTLVVNGQTFTVLLDGTTNQIGTLGAANAVGGLRVRNNQALAVTGPVTDTTRIDFNVAGALTLGGTVNAPVVTLGAGSVAQPGGTLTATTLSGAVTGGVALNQAGNSVANLGPFSSIGSFSLLDGRALSVAGAVQTTGAAPTLSLASDTISLATGGSLTATGGTVTLAPATAGAAFPLSSLVAGGATSAVFANTLQVGNATTGPITIDGAFNLSGTNTVRFVSSGAVTETRTGAITANTLAASAASVTLGGANRIATLGDVNSTGAFTLANGQALDLAGVVAVGTTAQLNVTGALTQSAGSLSANTLTGQATSIALNQAGNQIVNLGDLVATSSLSLRDGRSLTIVGVVDPPDMTLTVAGDLAINNNLTAGALTLAVTGTVTEGAAGFVTATSLQGSAASLRLDRASIDTLGAFASTGGFTLVDNKLLTVTGPVTDGASVALTGFSSFGFGDGLRVAGDITAPTVALVGRATSVPGGTNGLIVQSAGRISATNLSMTSDAGVSQTGGGITAGTVSVAGQRFSVLLDSATNQIGTLASASAVGGLRVRDNQALTVAGPVTDTAFATFDVTGPLTLAGTVNAPTVTLGATGAITQTAGAITATTLAGSAGGAVALNQAANRVTNLGAFSAAGSFGLVDGAALTVNGAVQATGTAPALSLSSDTIGLAAGGSLTALGGTVTLAPATAGAAFPLSSLVAGGATSAVFADTLQIGNATTGAITVDGAFNLSGTNTLRFVTPSSVTETGTGAITGNTLALNVGTATLTGANRFANLGDVTTGAGGGAGGLNLTNAQALDLRGAINSGAALRLTVAGALSQSAGSVTTTTLSGSAATISLNAAGNQIAAIGPFAATGAFALTDARSLTIAGASGGTTTTLGVTGDLAINAALSGTAVTLNATGNITEGAAGSVTATSLTGSAGSAVLGQANAVDALGAFASARGFALTDSRALTVNGPVTDGVSVALNGVGPLAVAGSITAPSVSLATVRGDITQTAGTIAASTGLALNAPGGSVSQTGGAILAGTVSGASAGTTAFNQAANRIGTLGTYTSTGGFFLRNGQGLSQTGALADTTRVAFDVAGGLALGGTINTGGLTLAATGAITQPGGALTATTLTGSAGGAVALNQAANRVTNLGAFSAAGSFGLVDGATLTVNGAVQATGTAPALSLSSDTIGLAAGGSLTAVGGTVTLAPATAGAAFPLSSLVAGGATSAVFADTLQIGNATTGAISIDGGFNLSGTNTLRFVSGGAVTETATGAITGNTLAANAASVTLAGANRFATLGDVAVAGGFTLANAQALNLVGTISAGTLVRLDVTGALTQTGGAILADTFAGSAGSVSLTSAANRIANLGPFVTVGDFALTDGRSLTVVAPVDPGDVTITVNGDLVLNSSVTANTLTFLVTGSITEGTGGSVVATTLRGTAATARLDQINTVGTLADFTSTGGFLLRDGTALAVKGPVVDGASVSLSSIGPMTVSGAITAPSVSLATVRGDIVQTAGTVTAPGGLSLTAGGAVAQSGGSILAGTLGGSSAGATTLNQAANRIGVLNAYSSVGGFSLQDGQALTQAGALSDTVRIGLNATGSLVLGGTLTAPAVDLVATAAITQPGGSIAATTVTGSGASAALNQRGNAIGNLGAFTTGGAFSLVDGAPLNVTGAVAAVGTLALASDSIALQKGGSLAAPAGTVALSTTTAGAPLALNSFVPAGTVSAVTADTLQVGSAATGDITVGGAFNLTNVGTLNLVSGGTIAEGTGGSLAVGRLTASGTTIALGGANAVGTLGTSTATGAFTLVNAAGTPLLVAGAVSAGGPLALTASGITLGTTATAGTLTSPGLVTLTSTGALAAPNGGVAAGTLAGTATSVSLGGTNRVGTLAGFGVTGQGAGGSFVFVDQGALAVTGTVNAPGNVTVQATGALSLGADVVGDTLTLGGSAISQPQGALTANTLNVASGGDARLRGQVGRLGSAQAPGTFALLDTSPTLIVAGPVAVGTLNLSGGAALTLAGTVTAGAVQLATGPVTQTGGSFQAATLTGTSTGAVQLGGAGTTTVGTLGDFTATSLSLTNAASLIVAGTVRAPVLTLLAPGSITLRDGLIASDTATITVGGARGQLVQSGTTVLTPASAARASVRLAVDQGSIGLANLVGPNANLVLSMNGGTATGALAVADLLVADQRGGATLTGSVAGKTGFDAAIASRITAFDTAYTLNGCAIASVSCVAIVPPPPTPDPTPTPTPTPDQPVVRVVLPSTIRPDILIVQEFLRPYLFTADLVILDIARNPADPDFALPNISDRDY